MGLLRWIWTRLTETPRERMWRKAPRIVLPPCQFVMYGRVGSTYIIEVVDELD